jgi:two-component system, LytTR family, response regulator
MNTVNLNNHLFALPTAKGKEIIDSNKIIRIAASSNYSKLYFADGSTLVVAKVLSWFEEVCPLRQFLRVHRGHLINPLFIKRYLNQQGGRVLLHNGDCIDVARRKKSVFLKYWLTAGTGMVA